MDFEGLTNKKFAYTCCNLLKDNGCLKEKEINILTDIEQCKRLFNCTAFPVLTEVSLHDPVEDADCYDDHGRQRFYKEKIYAVGRAFLVTNHWYGPEKSMPDNRTPFLNWVLDRIE